MDEVGELVLEAVELAHSNMAWGHEANGWQQQQGVLSAVPSNGSSSQQQPELRFSSDRCLCTLGHHADDPAHSAAARCGAMRGA